MFAKTTVRIRGIATTPRKVQEVQIPVAWGHIAGKWWGPQNKRPIIAFHGWQDNCGTFDTLLPRLHDHIPVLAVDFPGHGHSSCLPPGIPYYNVIFNKVILMKQLAQYFGWKRLSLMGHSLGAVAAYTYAFLFPTEVDFLICLDGLYPPSYPNEYDRIAKCIEQFIKYDKLVESKLEPPSYIYAEMVEKTHGGSHLHSIKSIDLESARFLLARNMEPSELYPGKFYFKRDPRIKVGVFEVHNPAEYVKCASRIECPVLVTKTRRGSLLDDESLCKDVLARIKRCELHEVPGTHHVHLNQPEVIAGLLNDFILKYDLDDRTHGGLKKETKVKEEACT